MSSQQNSIKQWEEGVIRGIGWRIHDAPKQKLFAEIVPDDGSLPPWLRLIYQVTDVFVFAESKGYRGYSNHIISMFLLRSMDRFVDLCDMLTEG
jgi:hypothetical protein